MTDQAHESHAEQESHDGEVAGGWSYIAAASAPLAFALFMSVQSMSLGLGSLSAPGPGLWPFTLSVSLGAASVVLLIGWSRFGTCEAWGPGAARVGVGAVSVAPFILIAPRTGFEIPAVLLLAFWMKVLGGEGWFTSVVVAVGSVIVLHVLFIESLGMTIPHLFGI